MGIRISVDGDGEIIIKRKAHKDKLKTSPQKDKGIDLSGPGIGSASLSFSNNILNQIEIRVEGVFRPNLQDVETAYGISGKNTIDMMHKFTSSEVIREATAFAIYTTTENKIRHILEERGENPRIVADVHTHPGGIAELSKEDKNTIKKIGPVFRENLPGVKIFFGVHAVSEEKSLIKRIKPEGFGNRIKWRSINREHEVAFFDEDSRPVEVSLWGR